MIAHRVDAQTNPTIAFLARGIEGLVVRAHREGGDRGRGTRPHRGRGGRAAVDPRSLVFGIDDETIEHAALRALEARGWTLGVAESVTAGLIGARIGAVPGASTSFRGRSSPTPPTSSASCSASAADLVVSEEAASRWRRAPQRVLGADVGIAATGVAGPDEQDGRPVGTVWFGLALPGRDAETFTVRLAGRPRARPPVLGDHAAQHAAPAARGAGPLGRTSCRRRAFLAAVPPPAGPRLDRDARRGRLPAWLQVDPAGPVAS